VSRFVLELFRKNMFFTYAVKYRAEIAAQQTGGVIRPSFEVTPAQVSDFRAFVFADTAFSRYRGTAATALEQSRTAWKRERTARGDTASATAEFDRAFTALDDMLVAEAAREFEANLDLIKRELKAELLGAALGEDART